jgi:hypothetical protein
MGFLAQVGASEDSRDPSAAIRHLFREPAWNAHDHRFAVALGELRAGVGLQMATIAAAFRP